MKLIFGALIILSVFAQADTCYAFDWKELHQFADSISLSQALEELEKNPNSLDKLIQALEDKDRFVRASVARSLGELGSLQAVPALCRALTDDDWLVRADVAEALGKLGDKRAVEPLFQGLFDDTGLVRQRTATALEKIGDVRAIPVLEQIQDDKDTSVSRTVSNALEKLRSEPDSG